jgi:hypothetical protein
MDLLTVVGQTDIHNGWNKVILDSDLFFVNFLTIFLTSSV